MNYDAILVPTDGSEHAARAGAHALSLASALDATVHVLSVVDLIAAAGPFDAGGLDEEFVDRLHREAERAIEEITAQSGPSHQLTSEVREGSPSECILEYVEDEGIGLVAMGTHGRTGLRRYVLGSVTEHVIRESSVPVVVTGLSEQPPTLPYQEVLIPTDGSDCANEAVDHAFAVATACDARLHAVHVVEEDSVASGPGSVVPSDYLEDLEAAGESAVEMLVSRARAADLDIESAIERGRPSSAIDSYADEHDVDLIVMGTHGRSGLERAILGSTTERLIRRSDVPVLAVPEGSSADT